MRNLLLVGSEILQLNFELESNINLTLTDRTFYFQPSKFQRKEIYMCLSTH